MGIDTKFIHFFVGFKHIILCEITLEIYVAIGNKNIVVIILSVRRRKCQAKFRLEI